MVLALVGCGTRSNMGGREAGTSPDSRAHDDGTGASDASAPTDPPVDSLRPPDLAPDRGFPTPDMAADALPDLLAQPEVSADLVFQDARPETAAPDRMGPDITPNDTVDARFPDAKAEAPLADGQPDLAADRAAEVAPESQPPVVDGPASFCTGSMARLVLNGTEAYPAVHGKNLPLSCCFSNQLEIISATVGFPLTVTWHTMAGGLSSTTPADLDLANLPQGWTVRVVAGCDPIMSTCSTPGDIYDSGLEGSMQVTRLASGYETTLCLHLVEPAGSSHPLIHTMDLYVPHVVATY
jgi:hypothetical protein